MSSSLKTFVATIAKSPEMKTNKKEEKKEHDLINTLDLFLGSFGYNVELKLTNQKQLFQKIKFLLFTSWFLFQQIIYWFFSDNDTLKEIFADTGFYLSKPGYLRRPMARVGFGLQSFWILIQLVYITDDYTWIGQANSIFNRVEWIRIPPRVIQMIPVMKMANLGVCLGFVIVRVTLVYVRLQESIWTGNICLLHAFHGFITINALYTFAIYYSGMFVCKFFLLLNLSVAFCSQFTEHCKKLLEKGISKEGVKRVFIQYQLLYELMQQLNSHITIIYTIVVVISFSMGLFLYEVLWSGQSNSSHRIMIAFMAMVFSGQVVYFSWIAGIANVKIQELSRVMYHALVVRKRCLDLPPKRRVID